MIDTDKYKDAKKMVEDAGLIDDNDGWLDVHYRKIAHLLAEVKRLREEIKKLQQIIGEITDLCMEEIERKGAYDAPQIALEIMERIDE